MAKAYIKEIFYSMQGEGPYIGMPQLFIRFAGCNLKCRYCDTDFEYTHVSPYNPQQLISEVNRRGKNLTVSLTGGEPLLSVDFLKEFLPLLKESGHTVYLETNGTLPDALEQVINYVDIVAADIKLESSSSNKIPYKTVYDFFNIATKKKTFAKIVFDENITKDESYSFITIAMKFNLLLVLQPKMDGDKLAVPYEFCEKIFNEITTSYKKVRLIPQVHKFLNIK